jgi:glycosyltransferase involved in cell wall biosynthesis
MRNRSDAVILFAYYYAPAITSGVQRAARFSKYLPRHRCPTYVICSSSGGTCNLKNVIYTPGASHPNGWSRTAAAAIQRFLPYDEQLTWVPYATAAAAKVISEHGAGTVISTSPPVGSHVAAYWLKKRYGLKWIADLRDPILGNPGRARSWARRYDAMLEHAVFASADAVIGVTDRMVQRWRQQYPRHADKFHVLWNGYDPEELVPAATAQPRSYHLMSHVGVLYEQRHPVRLFTALENLIKAGRLKPESLRLSFLGLIESEERLRSLASTNFLLDRGCLEFRGQVVPRQEALSTASGSDSLLLIDIVNLSNVGYTVPAKLYDYVLTGRPILTLTDHGSPVDNIVERCGIPSVRLYHDDKEEEVQRKLVSLVQAPTSVTKPSAWFRETFDGERQAGALAGILRTLRN